jgi:hypothetical protein
MSKRSRFRRDQHPFLPLWPLVRSIGILAIFGPGNALFPLPKFLSGAFGRSSRAR